ncbi:TetR/AcrR family transcriptional regulator [uncultured Bosea sp.]|uniref:TetR/AcrR family transcriptional regulator n=1 Tax=uncultured Bosea sp. TaxID=211457 RepID=UPI0025DD5639|nr:TetR/AcrR family transcriptional regulator [uncultured Bosea sp.]
MPGRNAKPMNSVAEQPAKKRGRPSMKAVLLDAALDLVAEGGVQALTYEALAERTGASKGGLLYHFPSKEALFQEITEQLIARYRAARQSAIEALPASPARELKGNTIASLRNSSKSDNVSAKMMVSGLWDAEQGKKYRRARFDEMSSGAGFNRTAVVYLATEGLWFMELAGRSPFTAEERVKIETILLALADGAQIETALDGTAQDK